MLTHDTGPENKLSKGLNLCVFYFPIEITPFFVM